MIKVSKNLIGFNNLLIELANNLFNKSLPNSLIFYGNKGIGKTTFCYSFIDLVYKKLYSSKHRSNLIYNNSHPKFRILNRLFDEKTKKLKNYITIDQIRVLESFIFQSSFDNHPKFVIVDSADDLNINSSNALLKILEEPKKNTYFILISHQLSNLIPTITSRCVKFKFINPTKEQFNKIINNIDKSINISSLAFLYDLSNGSPGLALQIYSENIRGIFDLLLNIFKEKKPLSSDILNLSNNMGSFNNDQFRIFLLLVKFILMNTVKINIGYNAKSFLVSDISHSLQILSEFIDNETALNILQYLNIKEKDLFIFNLDKKFFVLNIFSQLSQDQ